MDLTEIPNAIRARDGEAGQRFYFGSPRVRRCGSVGCGSEGAVDTKALLAVPVVVLGGIASGRCADCVCNFREITVRIFAAGLNMLAPCQHEP